MTPFDHSKRKSYPTPSRGATSSPSYRLGRQVSLLSATSGNSRRINCSHFAAHRPDEGPSGWARGQWCYRYFPELFLNKTEAKKRYARLFAGGIAYYMSLPKGLCSPVFSRIFASGTSAALPLTRPIASASGATIFVPNIDSSQS